MSSLASTTAYTFFKSKQLRGIGKFLGTDKHPFQKSHSVQVTMQLSSRSLNYASFRVRYLNSTTNPQSARFAVLNHLRIPCRCHTMDSILPFSSKPAEKASVIRWGGIPTSWTARGVSGLAFGICLLLVNLQVVRAESDKMSSNKRVEIESSGAVSHGKTVYKDYSVIGIPGDGRCLFRSVVHGACVVSGKPLPNESLQRKLADELRDSVADEFEKRRDETEWFIEGDFDSYIDNIRKPHVWGGEPELLMASHVLRMPITVYMHDEDCGGLIAIAEYGQEYGKKPIQVLYHGVGHYDALQLQQISGRSRL